MSASESRESSLRPVSGSARDVWELVQGWLSDSDDAILIRTSGSTGEPKNIELSKAAVLASANATLDYLGGPGQWLMALPPSGMGGFQVLVRSAVAGIEPVFLDDYPDLVTAAEAVRELASERSYLSLVPTQMHRLAESGQLASLAIFNTVLLGGAATSRTLLNTAADAGVRVVRTYGMTETAGGCIYDGEPLAGVDFRIETDGRVSLKGPMLFMGAPEWWTTSDLGQINDSGRLDVLGRADQVAISGGLNIPLGAVEAVLSELPQVKQLVVVARADEQWGQVVTACVSGELDRETAAAALEAAGHPRTWTPRVIETYETFPLLPGGKIDRQVLSSPSLP